MPYPVLSRSVYEVFCGTAAEPVLSRGVKWSESALKVSPLLVLKYRASFQVTPDRDEAICFVP